eukprot:7669445-Pyramimonas_sp.AAC.1
MTSTGPVDKSGQDTRAQRAGRRQSAQAPTRAALRGLLRQSDDSHNNREEEENLDGLGKCASPRSPEPPT